MKLVFTWIQWCGKWTQAKLLVDKYDFKLVEMWWVLRSIAKEDSELGRSVKETIVAWHQVSPEIVWKIIKKTVETETHDRVIYDWFVRNEWNKDTMDQACPDYKVVFFELSKDKAIERLLWRMYDPVSWETFPTWTLENPVSWTKLIKRKDDNEDSILTRINAFFEKTLPIVDLQRNEWRVIDINADKSINEVALEMVKKLDL